MIYAKKSMENTIETEKHLKVQENLHNLNKYVYKQHLRHSSHTSNFTKCKKDLFNETR